MDDTSQIISFNAPKEAVALNVLKKVENKAVLVAVAFLSALIESLLTN